MRSRKWRVKICLNIFFEFRSSFPFGNRTAKFANQINPNIELLRNMWGFSSKCGDFGARNGIF